MLVEGEIKADYSRVEVKYYPRRSVLGALPAVLEVDDRGVVSLTTDDGRTIFRCPVKDIKKVGTSSSVLFIITGTGTHKVEFGYLAGALIGAGAGLKGHKGSGRITRAGIGKLEDNGYYWWINYFKQAGIKTAMAPLIKFILIFLFNVLLLIILAGVISI